MSRLQVALDGDTVKAQVEPMTGVLVGFSAARVKNRNSGYHANVRITLSGQLLAGDLLNFEKNAQRVSLANAAHAMMPDVLKDEYSRLYLKRDLDEFAESIWSVYNGQFEAKWVEGDPESNARWLCPPLVMQDGSTILFGRRGGGKSVTAKAAAISTQHGISNLWNPIEVANVLYINIERGEDSMRRRVARVNVALGLSAYEPLLMLNARGKSLDNIYDAARKSIKQHEVQVVFFDSISRSGAGDLNENEPANLVMDMLSALTPTWLAIAHMTEQDGGKAKVFGSQMYENAADVVVRLNSDSQGDSLGVGMEIIKANDTALGQNQYIRYEFNGTGLIGIRPSRLSEFPDLDQKPPSNREKIATFIGNTPESKATSSEIAKALALNQGTVSKILQQSMFTPLPKNGSERPYAVASYDEV
jgi:hypothetical protein